MRRMHTKGHSLLPCILAQVFSCHRFVEARISLTQGQSLLQGPVVHTEFQTGLHSGGEKCLSLSISALPLLSGTSKTS